MSRRCLPALGWKLDGAGGFSQAPMSDNFIQRGGWWVIWQSLLMLLIAILGFVSTNGSNHPSPFRCGQVFLGIGAFCGIAGALSLGQI